MTDILPIHIEYLLTRHDCVIVPGLGAFIASEQEACIDLERSIILPRRRELSFNSSVVTDDGLLTHSIARREGLSYEDARRLVSTLAERMAADLRDEGEVSLGMTGRLVKDAEGLISFQPRRSAILSDIMQEIRLANAKPATSSASAEEEPETMSEDKAFREEDGMRTIRVKTDRYVFTVRKRVAHAAAMLAVMLTVCLSLLVPINHDNEQKASVISIEEFFRRAVKSDANQVKEEPDVNVEENDSTPAAQALKTR